MKAQSRAVYLLIGFLIAALLFTLVAAKTSPSQYLIYNYSNRIVMLDQDTGNLEIVSLTKDVVGNKHVPREIISVDYGNATYSRRLFHKQ